MISPELFWLKPEDVQPVVEFQQEGGTKGNKKGSKKGGTKGGIKDGRKTSKEPNERTSVSTAKNIGIKWNARGGEKGGTKTHLTKRQHELYKLLYDDNSLSIDDVAIIFKINASATQKHFEALKQKGIIRRMGPIKGGFWEVLIKL